MFGHGAWLFGDCVGVPVDSVDRVRGVMGVLGLPASKSDRKLTTNCYSTWIGIYIYNIYIYTQYILHTYIYIISIPIDK